ncbi:hypothetical protein LguiB_018274 [Lonicera macranthoides]
MGNSTNGGGKKEVRSQNWNTHSHLLQSMPTKLSHPDLVNEQDSRLRSPLHLGSANKHVENPSKEANEAESLVH